MVSFNIIVALDAKNGIGKKNQMPWHLPGELKHFKEITTHTHSPVKKNAVIMGRKTWESLPEKFRPLPNRVNIVLTRNQKFPLPNGVLNARGLDDALTILKNDPFKNIIEGVFVIGGGEIFKEAVQFPECQKIFMTHILEDFHCDAFFPSVDTAFEKKASSALQKEGMINYSFAEYHRRFHS